MSDSDLGLTRRHAAQLTVTAGALLLSLVPPLNGRASAATPLERVESEVFEAPGDVSALTRRGQTCISQIVRPLLATEQVILNADSEAGVVVANNAVVYNVLGVTPFRLRSTLTFEAKPGHFRIVHTDIRALAGSAFNWSPVYLWRPAAVAHLQAVSQRVADCIRTPPSTW